MDAEFWYEIVRTHEALFRQFAEELHPERGTYDEGRRDAYLIAAECLAFVLADNKEFVA